MDSVRTALALVPPFFAEPGRSFEARLRQFVNEYVTEDFLGPGWRRGHPSLEDADREQANRLRFDEKILSAQYSRQLLTLARLSPAETEVLAAVTAGYEISEIAAGTGRAESTVRNLLGRARARIKKARELVA
ncbi:MAG: hypothetical protein IT352_18910 [Gemmatimonadales bacterium]|nr:hypothetical protein [Gemmatimonadales bacterium]